MKKILYFLPFILWSALIIFIGTVVSFHHINPIALLYLLMLFVSGILMFKNKWWGCILGILFGIELILMGLVGIEETKIVNEAPFGIILCVYYAYLGRDLYKNK